MWVTIGIIFVIAWGWLAWEIKNAPIMPDDYDFQERFNKIDKNKGYNIKQSPKYHQHQHS